MKLRYPLLSMLLAAGIAGLATGARHSAVRAERVVESHAPGAILLARGGYHRRHRDGKPAPSQVRRSGADATELAAAQAPAVHQA